MTSSAQKATLEAFADAVAASPHNLVSRQALRELRSRHLPESVAFAHALPDGPAQMLDIGSGGGFPGMVVAIVRPDLRVELLDSTRKKVAFLQEVATRLEIPVAAVHHGRAEELARTTLAGRFDLVTARAVAPLERLVTLAVPFLRPGGQLHAIKGQRWSEEVVAATDALRRSGARILSTPAADGAAADPAAPRVVSIIRSEP